MRYLVTLAALLLLTSAQARVVFCKVSPTDFGPSTISWDDSTKVAKVFNPLYGTLTGRVSKLASAPGSSRVANLIFTAIPADWKQSEWEFVIHRATDGFAVEGVAYVTVRGVRYLDVILIAKDAVCNLD